MKNYLNSSETLFQNIKKMGLLSFQNRQEIFLSGIDEKMMKAAGRGDELFIVGRTLRWLLQQKKDIFLEMFEKGCNLKILLLNLQKVSRGLVDVRVIQLNDPKPVEEDLKIAMEHIDSIVQQLVNKQYQGSFECRTCDFIITNSFIILTQLNKMKRSLILDFSFGGKIEEKFYQYYECSLRDEDQFVNVLYRFYKMIYNNCQIFEKYTAK